MENRSPEKQKSKKGWFNRLDSAAAQVNPVLLVLAIGLAVLDFTCLFAIELRDALPAARRIAAERSRAAAASIPIDRSGGTQAPGPGRRHAGGAQCRGPVVTQFEI